MPSQTMSFQSNNNNGRRRDGSRNPNPTRNARQEWIPKGSPSTSIPAPTPPPPASVASTTLVSPPLNSNNSDFNGTSGPSTHHTAVGGVGVSAPIDRHKGNSSRGKFDQNQRKDGEGIVGKCLVDKNSSVPQLVQELQEKLTKGIVECMICYDMVRRSSPIWSCSSCFSIFHLNCIKKWARGTNFC